jgi:hypothetical protein
LDLLSTIFARCLYRRLRSAIWVRFLRSNQGESYKRAQKNTPITPPSLPTLMSFASAKSNWRVGLSSLRVLKYASFSWASISASMVDYQTKNVVLLSRSGLLRLFSSVGVLGEAEMRVGIFVFKTFSFSTGMFGRLVHFRSLLNYAINKKEKISSK